ncbi:hypothetical protein ACFC4G_48315 [Streptomyces sp. NPDC056002]|uniref:hypothetical protein n=1 Tax=Streptomyces sp. NPDC056002 TaxID=3345675 RepID=UPI0035E21F2D
MTKCPRCFSVLNPNHFLWTLIPQPGAPRYRDDVASAYLGAPAECGPLYTWTNTGQGGPPSTADASRALQGPAVEICTVCHYTLPEGWRHGHAICIAMAGARATGKSLYIAVLVKQLELLCERLGVSMEPVTRATAQAYEANYETPLYVQRGLIPPTPTMHTQASSQREPLVFSIGGWHGVRRFLVLRDVAGEDMESGDLHTPPFRFFANADAVFFMFDPLRVQTIRDQLRDLLPAQQFSGGDPRSVLNNLLMAVGQGQPKLAVILSKFDVLRALRDVQGSEWALVMSNGGAAFLRDTSDGKQYDDVDAQLLDQEVRSLLVRLHGGSIVSAVENPSVGARLATRYFAVSALGHPPTGNRLHARGIAPFRCLDPVRWVTTQFGVL